MGRPLFSNHQQTPAVRVEPEQPQPTCEKWTYWNAFDPDSDEFFERSDAVYEAFMPQDGTALPQPPPLIEVPPSSSSSEASSSGRGSPTEEARRDLSSEEIDLALRREADLIRLSATREDEIQRRVREARETFTDTRSPGPTVPTDTDPQRVLRYVQGLDSISRQSQEATQIIRGLLPSADPAERAAARRFEEYMAHRNEPIDAQPRRADSSAPSGEEVVTARGIPVAVPSALPVSVTTTRSTLDSPSTPPSGARYLNDRLSTPPSRSPALDMSPSPPPSVTPRLYSWSSRNPMNSTPTSPAPAGPLRNRDARLSVEHISRLSDASPARTRSRPNVRHVPDRGYNHFPDAPRVDLSSWIVS